MDNTDPDPEVAERARGPRQFSASYKAKVLTEYDSLDKAGKGALLRREGLYSSLIFEWRKQRDRGTVLAPYDETLTDKRLTERRAWAEHVLMQLRDRLGDLGRYEFELHAGAAYSGHGLSTGLRTAGAIVVMPAVGLRQGQQLAFYREQRLRP